MQKYNFLLLLLIMLPACVSGNTMFNAEIMELDTSIVSKREYKALQTKGDELFREGEYMSARKKYLAMKAIPGFENDPVATEKDKLSISCFELANQASILLTKGKSKEANLLLEKLLVINPEDTKARTKFGEIWYDEGMKSFKEGNYTEAKASFLQSLEYSHVSKANAINLYINSCNAAIGKAKAEAALASQQKSVEIKQEPAVAQSPVIKQSTPAKVKSSSSLMLPKIGLGVVAIGAGLYANSIRSKFNSQISEVESMGRSISSFQGYKDYEAAYSSAETYKNNNEGKAKAMFGVAAAAVIAEGVLFMMGGKKNNRMVSFSPGEVSTVQLNFLLK